MRRRMTSIDCSAACAAEFAQALRRSCALRSGRRAPWAKVMVRRGPVVCCEIRRNARSARAFCGIDQRHARRIADHAAARIEDRGLASRSARPSARRCSRAADGAALLCRLQAAGASRPANRGRGSLACRNDGMLAAPMAAQFGRVNATPSTVTMMTTIMRQRGSCNMVQSRLWSRWRVQDRSWSALRAMARRITRTSTLGESSTRTSSSATERTLPISRRR